MSYEVLARKWRPQRFEEIVGQETVTRTLQNAIRSERIAHAFLFSGVRGAGKTSTARILAKALNCHAGLSSTPCGECPSCREIAAGNSVDVLEIDAASNTGVDSIRELRESVRYGTARDRFKIFIIDEVHMLSNAAFNALLKTLEEPPAHVKFILATTEYQKIPVTITSRCQQFEFKPLSFQLILDRLKLISSQEGIEISDYSLRAIASTAQGSMRDAQSTLDQIVSFSGKQISDEDVRTLLSVVDEKVIREIIDAVVEADRSRLIRQAQQLRETGTDPQNLCRKLVGHLRNLMVCKTLGWDEKILNLPDADKEAVLKQAERLSELDLIRFYDVLNRTDNELRWHSRPHVHLEMALMKLMELARLPTVEEVVSRLESGGLQRPERSAASPAPKPTLFDAASGESKEKLPKKAQETSSADSRQTKNESSGARDPAVTHLFAAVQMEELPLYSHLEHASKVTLDNGKLLIVFPKQEAFHRSVVLQPESLKKLEQLCARVTGSTPKIDIVLEDGEPVKPADPAEDPKVKMFTEVFPGKVSVEKEGED